MKTAELTGVHLDCAVAQALCGAEPDRVKVDRWLSGAIEVRVWNSAEKRVSHLFNPHENWALAGPIIEREKLRFIYGAGAKRDQWLAETHKMEWSFRGPTPLIAAMRCYVASKLGGECSLLTEEGV